MNQEHGFHQRVPTRILKQEILKTKMVWLFLLGIKYHIRHDLAQWDKEIYVVLKPKGVTNYEKEKSYKIIVLNCSC